MKVMITGASGTLGQGLCRRYKERGATVIAVSRREVVEGPWDHLLVSAQASYEDAVSLVDAQPDIIILNAGAIETEIDELGMPLPESLESLNQVNYVFPAQVMMAASKRATQAMQVIGVGSIADGSPSCFGPLYHASKASLHYFVSSVAPIAKSTNPHVSIRLYRPGVIKGPLSWAPVNRLNDKGYKVRAKRCESAPDADVVAERMVRWIESSSPIGSDPEPISFRFLKFFFAGFPSLYYKLQCLAWRKASRFTPQNYGQVENSATS
ncbi:SDR family NAD(P)-dependent oxidoreductase [Pseudobacteriovorax antillogorgiicola]|uniref:NADP-dependent 3-hydroxy acid dehydrogenase YdfG n=1 Tax=Pseudobacteriovorax antillogorgiicola TaxID=1513793 RepID=A0A1Y6BG13_9BACT|nr:SDR family oxidoreductase [Pseudobacteriovorax antillogorgiicola]TCS57402.1 NADP-dependent 3-hydroxy acid dehydrogenase YdfG [Pseudobacteriovorax antillogorgiicola]SMF01562.1 NADP-dependent 3-hydroxy acid dehydrogenase YdfG [Pseudobacteriovorax antillogorgiicola]